MKANVLKSEIVKNGYTQKEIAKMLGINPKTFYEKMKRKVFGTDEVAQMIKILNLKNPIEIFFED